MIQYSPLESNRFGLTVHRGVLKSLDLNYIKAYVSENNPDLLILRMDALLVDQFHELNLVEHYTSIFADALVYYYADLTSFQNPVYRNNLTFELINKTNVSEISLMVPEIFKDYTNHYSSNPILNKEKITEGYIEWAQDYVNEVSTDRISWLVKKEDITIGFATCSMDQDDLVSEGVLYGVLPQYSGGGVYTDIIKFTKQYFKNLGYKSMKVSTQLQNYAVQKVWTKEGFFLKHAYYTFHLNKVNF